MAEKTTAHHSTAWEGAFNIFGKAFERVKINYKPALLMAVVYLIIGAIQTAALNPGNKDMAILFGYDVLVSLLFLLALPTYGLAVADGKKISLGDFMKFDLKKYLVILAASILYGLIVAASLLLFIIPAVWTIAWFALCVLIAVDKNVGPIEALKESKRLVQNHKAKVWGIIGVSLLFSIAAGIVSIVPVLGPVINLLATVLITVLTTASTAYLYRWAQRQAQ